MRVGVARGGSAGRKSWRSAKLLMLVNTGSAVNVGRSPNE